VRRLLVAAAALALALPAAALAHVTVLPPYLEDGRRTTLVFSAPNERPPHSVVGLIVTVPARIELSAAAAPAGWTLADSGRRARWSGGRTPPRTVGTFRVAAVTSIQPGAVSILAVQRYSDGATVRWDIPLTVLPAPRSPKQHLWPALLAGLVGLAAIGGGLAWLETRRRSRPLQDS
jgi:uncharacterized protein YcnI